MTPEDFITLAKKILIGIIIVVIPLSIFVVGLLLIEKIL